MNPATTIQITLTPADRDRIGAPEVLSYDYDVLMLGEAERLQDQANLSPVDWVQQVADGWLPLINRRRSDLTPDQVTLALRIERAVVWIALHRAGVELPYATVDYDRRGMRLAFPPATPVGEDDPGKDPSTPSEPSPGDASS